MPEIKGDLPPMRDWCIPGGIGGPSDLTWQTGDGKKRHEAWKAKVLGKAVRDADLWKESHGRLSEFQRLMYRDA